MYTQGIQSPQLHHYCELHVRDQRPPSIQSAASSVYCLCLTVQVTSQVRTTLQAQSCNTRCGGVIQGAQGSFIFVAKSLCDKEQKSSLVKTQTASALLISVPLEPRRLPWTHECSLHNFWTDVWACFLTGKNGRVPHWINL